MCEEGCFYIHKVLIQGSNKNFILEEALGEKKDISEVTGQIGKTRICISRSEISNMKKLEILHYLH